jgi:hypothetical protein
MAGIKKREPRAGATTGYVVASEGIIIDILGWSKAFFPAGLSLNQMHLALNRLRSSSQRVNYYELKNTLKQMERKELVAHSKHKSWTVWKLFDWPAWWARQA